MALYGLFGILGIIIKISSLLNIDIIIVSYQHFRLCSFILTKNVYIWHFVFARCMTIAMTAG